MSTWTKPQVNDEVDLVVLAKQGSADAFEQLVRKYQVMLRTFLVRKIGNADQADDVAQEVFIATIKSIGSIDENRPFSSWLLTVARNKAIDHLRNQIRKRETQIDGIESMLAANQLKQDANESDRRSLLPTLMNCIRQLKPHANRLIQMFYFENQTSEAIAKSLGQNSSSIRMSLLRIRKALGKCIRKSQERRSSK